MGTVNSDLNAVVERAYEVFPAQKLTGMGVCNCGMCMKDQAQAEMAAKDRRTITPFEFSVWNASASGESGLVPQNVARHIAPRLLELLASGQRQQGGDEIEIAFDKTAFGDRTRWIGEEADILDAFRVEYLNLFRGDTADGEMIDDALCMLAKGRFDLNPVLAFLETWPAEHLILRFWRDWVSWMKQPSLWRTTFWNPSSDSEATHLKPARDLTSDWYRGPHVRNALEQVFDVHDEGSEIWMKASYVQIALASYKGD